MERERYQWHRAVVMGPVERPANPLRLCVAISSFPCGSQANCVQARPMHGSIHLLTVCVCIINDDFNREAAVDCCWLTLHEKEKKFKYFK